MRTRHLNWLLIVASLLISTAPSYAQRQQEGTKLKARAQRMISSISSDKAKLRAYCELTDVGGQLVEAAEEKDEKKANALMAKVDELESIIGSEYHSLFDALYEADQNSKDVQDMLLMFASLDESCPR
jgi:predicted ribosome quality control (RQC) complex YloA/Tae2 family protein